MNTQRFQIGDVVRVIDTSPHNQRYFGAICTITSDLFEYDGELVHMLDLEPTPDYRGVCAPPRALELVYDGNRRVSWDQCAWRPLDVNLPDDTDTLPVHLRDPFAVIERGNFLLANGIPSKRPTVETDTYDEELRRSSSGPQAG